MYVCMYVCRDTMDSWLSVACILKAMTMLDPLTDYPAYPFSKAVARTTKCVPSMVSQPLEV